MSYNRRNSIEIPKQIGGGTGYLSSRQGYKSKDNEQHFVWGWNDSGQLGLGRGSKDIVKELTHLGDKVYFDSKVISIGLAHSLVIDSKGKLYSCGKSNFGRLGLGSDFNNGYGRATTGKSDQNQYEFREIKITSPTITNTLPTPISLSNYIKVNKISCGGAHSAFITENQQLFTFGKNNNGQTGHGLIDEQPTPKRVEYIQYNINESGTEITPKVTNYNDNVDLVACGLNHTVFSLKDGCVYSMGSNKFCQLGFKSVTTNNTTNINDNDETLLEHRPKLIEQLNKPTKHLEQRFTNIKSISCGSNFSACVKQGNIYTWGANELGQCGIDESIDGSGNDIKVISRPTLVIVYGDRSTLSNGDNNVDKKVYHFIQVSCGVGHCLSLTSKGQVFGWGDNRQSQLGQLNISSVLSIDTTTPIRIGESLLNEFITQVTSGAYHSMALSKSGHIYSWGCNDYNQIGCGDKNQPIQHTPYRVRIPSEKGEKDAPILQISAGGRSSMFIKYCPSKPNLRQSTYFQDIFQIYKSEHSESFSDLKVEILDGDDKCFKTFHLNFIFWNRSKRLNDLKLANTIKNETDHSTTFQFKQTDINVFFNQYYSIDEIIQDLYIDSPNGASLISTSVSEYLFGILHNQNLYYDIKIKVVDEQQNSETTFYCHKCILVNRSEKFKTLLQSSYFKESLDGEIVINGFSKDAYEMYLLFLYTDILNLTNENVIELFQLSHQESQFRMKDLIEEYLFNSLDVDNVSNIFELSLLLNDTAVSIDVVGNNNFLVEQCIYFIAKNLEQVEKTESWSNLSENSKSLLISNSINVQQTINTTTPDVIDKKKKKDITNDGNDKKSCIIC